MVITIDKLDELQKQLDDESNKDKLIVLDFFATWCGPCLRIAPKINDWSTGDFKDDVVFLKSDVDEAEDVAKKYDVEAMPTFVFFKNGKEIDRVVGANIDNLKTNIEKYTKKGSEEKTEKKTEEKPEKKTEEKTEKKTEEATEKKTEETTEKKTEEKTEEKTDKDKE
ncbi:hypothetical protein I4U23_020740 [Adineta vaga]|nr:hypothetical protein I4U23_020740 [Adineta vaga]